VPERVAGAVSRASPAIGVDVGGTAMKGLLVEIADGGEPVVVDRMRRPTPVGDGVDAVVAAIAAFVGDLADRAYRDGAGRPAAAGVVVPGIIDEAAGVVVGAANLAMRGVPLAELLRGATGLAVRLGHDVRAGGVAEARAGAARGERDVLFVPLGTGIAASCVVDGRAIVAGGYAGELGHLLIRPGGETCPCGQAGCLERYASASAVARHYTEASGRAVTGAVDVAELVRFGDPVAVAVWDDAVDALVTALLAACTLLGSAVVVLGGGLSHAGELLLDPVRERLHARMTFHRRPRVVAAQLGDQAGAIGAALLGAAAFNGRLGS